MAAWRRSRKYSCRRNFDDAIFLEGLPTTGCGRQRSSGSEPVAREGRRLPLQYRLVCRQRLGMPGRRTSPGPPQMEIGRACPVEVGRRLRRWLPPPGLAAPLATSERERERGCGSSPTCLTCGIGLGPGLPMITTPASSARKLPSVLSGVEVSDAGLSCVSARSVMDGMKTLCGSISIVLGSTSPTISAGGSGAAAASA